MQADVQVDMQDMVIVANQDRAAAVEEGILLAAHRDPVMVLVVFQECMGMGWLEMVSPVVVEVGAMPFPEKNQKDKKLLDECFLVAPQEGKKQFSQKDWKH